MKTPYLRGDQPRARWKRLDTAQILKRFFFCERSLIVSASAWIPHIADLDLKMSIPYYVWQNSETANDLRERVFQLRFPSRLMEHEGADKPLVDVLNQLRQAPDTEAFLKGFATVALPAIRDAYQEFIDRADPLADAPTYRFLELSLAEKKRQIDALTRSSSQWMGAAQEKSPLVTNWVQGFAEQLARLGGVGTDEPLAARTIEPIDGSRPLIIPEKPARDPRYWPCRFYWPDIVDSNFPYGHGLGLQLRSAVSHLNEVWAVEHGGIILSEFAEVLPWDWIYDAARWTYDESRHCRMGQNRLAAWGFDPGEVPLGSYIYESANGGETIDRLGMLYFFETKNIGRKPERTAAFKEIGDAASEHDMDFDWADETIHATYGNRWLRVLNELDPNRYPPAQEIRERCEGMVARMIASATPAERKTISQRAKDMFERAAVLANAD
jgi:hypothetical protein